MKYRYFFSFDILCEALRCFSMAHLTGPRRRILVRRVRASTPIFSRTRAPLESSRRCCRRRGDKSSLSLPGPLSQADTRELTDRTVAIKPPPKRIRGALRATNGSHGRAMVRGKRTSGVIKEHERDSREGDGAQISSTTPARCTRRRMIPCVAAGS